MDWSSLLEFNVSPLELVVRGTAIYWFLFLVFRFVLHRDVGGIGVADVLLVVLVADASQNAMTGGYTTTAEGVVLISTLVGWNYLLDWAALQFPVLARFVEPRPLLLIRRGRIVHKNLRAEHLTMADLHSHLRQSGVNKVAEVRRAYMESDGNLSVIRFDRGPSETPTRSKAQK